MTVFELNTEGHFCARCQQYRVRTVGALCPPCLDEDHRAEKAAREKEQVS